MKTVFFLEEKLENEKDEELNDNFRVFKSNVSIGVDPLETPLAGETSPDELMPPENPENEIESEISEISNFVDVEELETIEDRNIALEIVRKLLMVKVTYGSSPNPDPKVQRILQDAKVALDDAYVALEKVDSALNRLDPKAKSKPMKWRILPPFKGSPNSLVVGQNSNFIEPYIPTVLDRIKIQEIITKVQPYIDQILHIIRS